MEVKNTIEQPIDRKIESGLELSEDIQEKVESTDEDNVIDLEEDSTDTYFRKMQIDEEFELNKVAGMNMMEAMQYKNQIDNYRIHLKTMKNMVSELSSLEIKDDTSKNVALSSELDRFNMEVTHTQFMERYDGMENTLTNIAMAIKSKIEANIDELDSTKFMTNDMIEILDKRMEKLDPNHINYKYIVECMNNMREGFLHRGDLTPVINNFAVYIKTNAKDIKKTFNKSAKSLKSTKSSPVVNLMYRQFNNNMAHSFQSLIKQYANDMNLGMSKAIDIAFLLMIFVTKRMETGVKKNTNTPYKVFVMNLHDIKGRIYDYSDVDEYITSVKSLITLADRFLSSNGLTLGIKYTSYGIEEEERFDLKTMMDLKEQDIQNFKPEDVNSDEDESLGSGINGLTRMADEIKESINAANEISDMESELGDHTESIGNSVGRGSSVGIISGE